MNYYEILGIERTAADEEIRQAYRREALKWHPDKNLQNKVEAEERFKKIANAYETLSNTNKRKEYNKFLDDVEVVQEPEDDENRKSSGKSTETNNNNKRREWNDDPNVDLKYSEELFKRLNKALEDHHLKEELGVQLANEAREGNWDAVGKLITEGAYLDKLDNENKLSALHYAVKNNHSSKVESLIKFNCNINVRNANNETPLYLAVENDNFDICKHLVINKAELHHQNHSHKYTALHLSIYDKKDKKIQELLIKNSKNYGFFNNYPILDIQNFRGNTPLHLAIKTSQYDIAIFLIQKGAKVNIENNNRETADILIFKLHLDDSQNSKLSELYGLSKKISKEEFESQFTCIVM